MLKERLKTFLLLFLVCISVFLTRRLWIKMPHQIIPLFKEEEVISANYLFTDMIKPHKYLLNFDEKNHTVFYNDDDNLWTSAHSSLVDILSSNNIKTDTLSNEEFLKYGNKKSIVFYFPEKFSTYILARSLDIIKPNIITEKMPEIDSIYFYLGIEEPYLVFSEDDKYLKIYDIGVDFENIKSRVDGIEKRKDYTYYYSMKDTLKVDNDIYIPYKMAKAIPSVYVENEFDIYNIEEIRNVAQKFFDKDIDYIREIIENNGSILYVYNQKVLKINQNGLLEYFNPIEEPVSESERNLYISLNTVVKFLSEHIGVPKDMYLAKIEQIEAEENFGYRLVFRYRIRGIPVLLGSDTVEDFIQVDVFNKYVRNYKRFIRKDMNFNIYNKEDNRDMLSAFDIINMNYDILEKGYIENKNIALEDINEETLTEEVLSSIENIAIAYLDPCEKEKEEQLIGVWMLQMEGRIYAFDVYDGSLVLERKQ